MADTSADEFSQFPVESIARFLSVCGNEDQNLLRRSKAPSGAEPPPARRRMTASATQHQSYLEELVSIAITSARQAEDAARQVHAASTSVRRRMFAISAFGTVGLLVGLAAIGSAETGYGLPWGHAGGGNGSVAARDMRSAAQPAAAISAAATVPSRGEVRVRMADVSTARVTAPVDLPAPPPMPTTEPTVPAPWADLGSTPPQSAEAAPHANASAQAAVQATAPAPVTVASATPPAPDKPAAGFVPPRPLPSQLHRVEVAHPAGVRSGGAPTTSASQLVAAVQALEALTGEQPSPGGERLPQFNNRM